MSLRFENPDALWGFLAVGLLIAIMFASRRRGRAFSWRRAFLALVGFSACVLGLARPQGGHYATTQRGMRGDLFVAVDISNSMRAEDISPSRLEFATAFVRRLMREVPGLRVAIFPFAGDGYLQMPLSSDQDAAADLVTSLTPSVTTNQGTRFDPSLESLMKAILKTKQSASYEPAPTRVLLLSDGETHEPVGNDILETFRGRSIPIDTVGVGTTDGGPIPGDGALGHTQAPLRDADGRPVRTRLDSKTLLKIADGTGGNYYSARFEEVGRIGGRILQGMEFGKLSTTFKLEKEYFPLLFVIALIAFSLEFVSGRWELWIRALAAAFLLASSPAQAEDAYQTYNDARRLLKDGNFADAAEKFEESAAVTKDPALRKRALYNLGNALVRLQDPTQALHAYQRAYDTNIDQDRLQKELNQNISDNILLARKMKQQQKEQQKGEEGEGEESPGQSPKDPGKPKEFRGQSFDEQQKKRMFDQISSEEQQILQRLQQGKNQKQAVDPKGKPW